MWLLSFYMVVATYFYHEKVRRTMRTAIVSNLLKSRSFLFLEKLLRFPGKTETTITQLEYDQTVD